jgi:hypothetical protein
VADAQTFFAQMLPEALNGAFEAFEKKVADAEAQGAPNAAELRAALDGIKSVDATMLVEITGDGGASYSFNQKNGRVVVSSAADNDAIVVLSQSLADYDALEKAGVTPILGGSGGGGGGGGGGRPSTRGARLFKPALVDRVASLDKVMKIVITDVPDHGATTTWLRLGRGAKQPEPDVTMTLSLNTYQDMVTGKIPPPAAFMQGLLKVEGDMALLMQLASVGMT